MDWLKNENECSPATAEAVPQAQPLQFVPKTLLPV